MSSAGSPTPTPNEPADESWDNADADEATERTPGQRASAGAKDRSGRRRRDGPAESDGEPVAADVPADGDPSGPASQGAVDETTDETTDEGRDGGDAGSATTVSPEAVAEIEAAAAIVERDELREALSRIQAEFENFKKRMLRQQSEHTERAAEQLVMKLLPVLDAIDLALAHHDASSDAGRDIASVASALGGMLGDEGLERVDPKGSPFDPSQAEAVAHEAPSDDDESEGPVVSEVLRPGYRWRGRVVRPAMVKVRG